MSADEPSTLGGRIRHARQRAALTQKALAAFMKTRQGDLSNWELDKHEPSLPALVKLAEVLRVSVDELLGVGPHLSQDRRITTTVIHHDDDAQARVLKHRAVTELRQIKTAFDAAIAGAIARWESADAPQRRSRRRGHRGGHD